MTIADQCIPEVLCAYVLFDQMAGEALVTTAGPSALEYNASLRGTQHNNYSHRLGGRAVRSARGWLEVGLRLAQGWLKRGSRPIRCNR